MPRCENGDRDDSGVNGREVRVEMCRVYEGGRQVGAGFREYAGDDYGEERLGLC